jgi:hypothetical protein
LRGTLLGLLDARAVALDLEDLGAMDEAVDVLERPKLWCIRCPFDTDLVLSLVVNKEARALFDTNSESERIALRLVTKKPEFGSSAAAPPAPLAAGAECRQGEGGIGGGYAAITRPS